MLSKCVYEKNYKSTSDWTFFSIWDFQFPLFFDYKCYDSKQRIFSGWLDVHEICKGFYYVLLLERVRPKLALITSLTDSSKIPFRTTIFLMRLICGCVLDLLKVHCDTVNGVGNKGLHIKDLLHIKDSHILFWLCYKPPKTQDT